MDNKGLSLFLKGKELKKLSDTLNSKLNKTIELDYINLLPNGNVEIKISMIEKRHRFTSVILTFLDILSSLEHNKFPEESIIISGETVYINLKDLLEITNELITWFTKYVDKDKMEKYLDFLGRLDNSSRLLIELMNEKKLEMVIPEDYYRSDTDNNKSIKLLLNNNPVLVDMDHYFNLWLDGKIDFKEKKRNSILVENIDIDR